MIIRYLTHKYISIQTCVSVQNHPQTIKYKPTQDPINNILKSCIYTELSVDNLNITIPINFF